MDNCALRRRMLGRLEHALLSVDRAQLDQLTEMVDRADRVFVAGAGRTQLGLRGFAMALMQIGLQSYVVGETTTPGIRAGDLLVAASNTGRTMTTRCFIQQARLQGAKVALITASPQSGAAASSDFVLTLQPAGDPLQQGDLTDSSFEYALLPLGDCVVEALARRRHQTLRDVMRRHANME